MIAANSPFPQFFDANGLPLDAGKIYIGAANLDPRTNPVSVFWDYAGTIPAAQPLATDGGYVVRNGSPALFYVSGNHSLAAYTSANVLVWSAAESAQYNIEQRAIAAATPGGFVSSADLASTASGKGAALVGFVASGAGAVARTALQKLREVVSVEDYGWSAAASSAANSAAFSSALAAVATGGKIIIPTGTYSGNLIITKGVTISGGGEPFYDGTTLIGGTIIVGKVTAYAAGVRLFDFGVNQTTTLDADGIVAGVTPDSARLDFVAERISVLGRGNAAGSVHGVIAQSGQGARINAKVFKYYHCIALRVSYGLAKDCYTEDADATSIIIKSGATYPANDIKHTRAVGCVAVVKTSGKKADFWAETSDASYTTNNASFVDCISVGSDGTPFKCHNTTGTGGTGLRNVTFDNCGVFSATGSRGFAFVDGDIVKATNCHVEGTPAYSFGGDGATNLRVLGCTSRSPSSGHYVGSFGEVEINGQKVLQPGTISDGGALAIPAGSLKTTPQAHQLEATTTNLYWTTTAGVRKTITLT
jgi:hypothetical protein